LLVLVPGLGDLRAATGSSLRPGGLAELRDADVVVSQAAWDTLSQPLPELAAGHVPGVGSRRRLAQATAPVTRPHVTQPSQ
jgi:hypothetical protein